MSCALNSVFPALVSREPLSEPCMKFGSNAIILYYLGLRLCGLAGLDLISRSCRAYYFAFPGLELDISSRHEYDFAAALPCCVHSLLVQKPTVFRVLPKTSVFIMTYHVAGFRATGRESLMQTPDEYLTVPC